MTPLLIINALKITDNYIEDIFLNGGCYQFHLFLKTLFPNSIPYINDKKNHIYTKIGNELYDILGTVENWEQEYVEPLNLEENPEVKEWSFSNHNWLKIRECPNCEEPITA